MRPSPVEDDLALFNEVQNKEIESFLLQSKVNFDDILPTELLSVSSRRVSNDLLEAEGDKNDYEWLISPPETPLFLSLDDEEPPKAYLAHRGRTKSEPVPILKSPTMENGHTSPRHLSSTPHSGNMPFQSRSKPFSVTHSSKLTPSPQRITSSGSAGTPSPSRARGTPVKTGRGNSSSPRKIKPRKSSNIHGFSSEAPQDLHTSLVDRLVSRNGTNSMSPTASRSVDSVASSGDDDLDSLTSFPVSRSAPRVVEVYPSNSPVSFSRKPGKSLSRSAPKRSFDLVRQMDRKGPQHMFRPLLSSVPSSTFHAGDASSQHYPPASINSSVTTCSSNSGSDLTTSGLHDTERSIEQNQEDHYSYTDDKVLVMIVAHNLNDTENRITGPLPDSPHGDIPSKQDTVDTVMDVMAMCSKCGQILNLEDVVIKGDPQYCRECKDSDTNPVVTNVVGISDWTASNTESMNVKGSQHLNSVKEHTVENRSYAASSTSYDDFSYVSNTSVSVSSSVDLGVSIRRIEGQIYRQFSGSKLDMENHRYEMPDMENHEREFEEKTCSEPCEQSVAAEAIEAESTNIVSNNVLSKTQENEEPLHAESEMSINEQDSGLQRSGDDMVDMDGVLYTSSLDAISEMVIENADVISVVSHSDVDSIESKSCMDEIQHDEEDITKPVGEFEVSRPECRRVLVTEESSVLLDGTSENEKTAPRSLTLEEATDAILFCSSIVHNLAYEAANTAINNETFSTEALRPTSAFLVKPDPERRDSKRLGTMRKRVSNTQKAQQKMPEEDTEPPPCSAETTETPKSPCVVRVPKVDVDNLKHPKLEPKCTCVIM